MIQIVKATLQDIDKVLDARYETIKTVCNLSDDYTFSESFMNNTKKYFQNSEQTTVLALDNDDVIGCATICYIWLMPTFDHPGGKRGHIMNVYTNTRFRRQGIGYKMMNILIDEARNNMVTELTLDATEGGRPLYEKCGFATSKEGMVLIL